MTRPPVRDGASVSSANLYGLVTLAAFAVFAPVAALADWRKWRPAWELALENGYEAKPLALSVVLSGVSHYLNNEVKPFFFFLWSDTGWTRVGGEGRGGGRGG